VISLEFALACLAATVVLLVPGFAVASLLAPQWHWWEQLAMAPGLTTGATGILGLVLHAAGLPFTPLVVALVVAVLVVSAVAQGWRRLLRDGRSPIEWKAPLIAVASGMTTVGIFIWSIRSELLPVFDDTAVHAAYAEAIKRSHDVLAAVAEPVSHSAAVRPRTAIEATAVVAGALAHQPPTQLLLPMGLVAAVVLALGLLQLSRLWTGTGSGLVLAPVLGVGMFLPVWPLLYGEYPLLIDATLIPGLLGAALLMLRGEDAYRAGLLMTVAVASIWVGHGLEILTAVTVGGLLVLRELVAVGRSSPWIRVAVRMGSMVVAGGVGALLVAALTAIWMPQVPNPISFPREGTPGRIFLLTPSTNHAPILGAMALSLQQILPNAPALFLDVVGCVWAVVRPRLAPLVVIHAGLVLMLYDVTNEFRLGRLWSGLYPWALQDRVIGMGYWVVPILIAAGAMWLFRKSASLRESTSHLGRRLSGLALFAVTAGLIIAGELLSLTFEGAVVSNQAVQYGKVTSADVTVLSRMKDLLPAGSVVLTDGEDDAGIWVDALTPQVAFMTKDWIGEHPDDAHFVALQNACADPGAASRTLLDVDAVFVGSRHNLNAFHPWEFVCVSRIPGLRLLAQATRDGKTAALFAVDRKSGQHP
jgi:hypothetical protein